MSLIIFNPTVSVTFDQISKSTTSSVTINIWSRMCNIQNTISRYQYPTFQTEKSFCICMKSCCVTAGPYTANSKVPLSPTHKCLQWCQQVHQTLIVCVSSSLHFRLQDACEKDSDTLRHLCQAVGCGVMYVCMLFCVPITDRASGCRKIVWMRVQPWCKITLWANCKSEGVIWTAGKTPGYSHYSPSQLRDAWTHTHAHTHTHTHIQTIDRR